MLRQLTESVQTGLDSGVFSDEAKEANEALVESFKVKEEGVLHDGVVLVIVTTVVDALHLFCDVAIAANTISLCGLPV